MTEPLAPPPRKNPDRPMAVPHLPPATRSRAALGLTAAAAEGRFRLQHCAACGAVQYPPRDACHRCLSTDLPWQDTDPMGTLLAETTVHATPDLYFRARTPWRMGTVRLDAGVSVLAHVHSAVARRGRVRLALRLDRAGQGVVLALPPEEVPHMAEDPELRELTCDPRHRRVLIADARQAEAPALAKALLGAGAAHVFAGEAESWRPNPLRAALAGAGAEIVPLDVTDERSVREAAGTLGGKVEILIANQRFVRPGGILARGDTGFARQEMEVNALGLMRLAQAFGPGMAARGADGIGNAVALVALLSAYAPVPDPAYGAFAASQAAALSVARSLRADLRAGGIRVVTAFAGPTEDAWHQHVPPPKLTPAALARGIVAALLGGVEEAWIGDAARDIAERLHADPKVLERELAEGSR